MGKGGQCGKERVEREEGRPTLRAGDDDGLALGRAHTESEERVSRSGSSTRAKERERKEEDETHEVLEQEAQRRRSVRHGVGPV